MSSGLIGFPPKVSVEPTHKTTLRDMVAQMRAQSVGRTIADCHLEGDAIVIVLDNGAQLRFSVPGGKFQGEMH